MSGKTLLIGAATGALVAMASAAAADDISANTWYSFGFTSTGTALYGPGYVVGTDAPGGATTAFAPSAPWIITLSGPATLTVTDLERSGDAFAIYDNGNLLGDTSTPVVGASYVGEDISAALADSNFSHGSWALDAGTNVITGVFLGSVGYGDAAFAVTSSVPEPAGWALMLLGVGGMGLVLRSRRKTVTA